MKIDEDVYMSNRNIIVIGASAGGFSALRQLVADLPADLNAAIFIVWHISPDVRGVLAQVLGRETKLHAAHAVDGEPINMGRIYVAPPDHHLLVSDGVVRVTRGPKENRFRPAVDPLFRSAAHSYGRRVIGVILTGGMDDGSAGLWTIKQHGGVAIVQDPHEAEVPSMPENAVRAVAVDHVVPLREIATLLTRLTAEKLPDKAGSVIEEDARTKREIDIAMENETFHANILEYGELTPYTCPECKGVLAALKEGGRIRFRCHTGHAYSADSLLASITESIEEGLWSAIRNAQECIMLLNHMGDHFAEVNDPRVAAMYFKKAKEAEIRASIVRKAVLDHELLSADNIREQANK